MVNFGDLLLRGIRAVVVLAPIVLVSVHSLWSYVSIDGWNNLKNLRERIYVSLSSVQNMETMVGELWKSIKE
jgi:hypothetical protein